MAADRDCNRPVRRDRRHDGGSVARDSVRRLDRESELAVRILSPGEQLTSLRERHCVRLANFHAHDVLGAQRVHEYGVHEPAALEGVIERIHAGVVAPVC